MLQFNSELSLGKRPALWPFGELQRFQQDPPIFLCVLEMVMDCD